MKKISENRKITLTLKQLKKLVKECRRPRRVRVNEERDSDYLSFDDLSEDQLEELRGHYFTELVNNGELDPAQGDVPEDITDEELRKEYGGTSFTCDDFFCTAGQHDEDIEVTDECGGEVVERHISGRKERRERKLRDKSRKNKY